MIPFFPDLTLAAHTAYSIAPQTISSATTTNGAAVDCLSEEGPLHAFVMTGDCGDGSTVITVKLQESTTTTSGDFADITGASKVYAASATANDNLAEFPFAVNNRSKRYVRAVVVTLGGTPSVIIGVAVVGRKKIAGASGVNVLN